jgi:hypothetical protein
MSFDETDHPRKTDGKFAEKTGASPEVKLPTRPAPLPRLSLQAYNHTVQHYTMERDGGDQFDLETPYQRGSVWDVERRQALVRSMLMGLPTGSVVINKRGYHLQKAYAVVDGKQRIETLRAWEKDEFTVPRHWFEDRFLEEPDSEEPEVAYSGLSIIGQRHWSNRPFSTLEANVKTVGEEAEIFRLINTGGVEQTEEDLANAARYENDTTFVGSEF